MSFSLKMLWCTFKFATAQKVNFSFWYSKQIDQTNQIQSTTAWACTTNVFVLTAGRTLFVVNQWGWWWPFVVHPLCLYHAVSDSSASQGWPSLLSFRCIRTLRCLTFPGAAHEGVLLFVTWHPRTHYHWLLLLMWGSSGNYVTFCGFYVFLKGKFGLS